MTVEDASKTLKIYEDPNTASGNVIQVGLFLPLWYMADGMPRSTARLTAAETFLLQLWKVGK